MLEPQSLVLFAALTAAFGLLAWRLVVTRRLAVRVVAGCLAFVVAAAVGILTVNRYFGYYATWGAAAADFASSGPAGGPEVSSASLLSGGSTGVLGRRAVDLRLARSQGYTLQLTLAGRASHISRIGDVYLPPQYFEPQYAKYRFPVIELIHGQPGAPQDWINVVGIQQTLETLVSRGQASPAVLVMPDANGGTQFSLQCLNQAGGPADLTYLAKEVPADVARMLRVQPPGQAWGIAGYSEGGFCAANMALRFRYRYGYAASMSGYFIPDDNKLGDPLRTVDPFGGSSALRAQNTPVDEVRQLAPGARLPLFWLGAGGDSPADVQAAEYFAQELQLHEAAVPLVITPRGGHTMDTWHAEVPPMLTWMTRGLAATVRHQTQVRLAGARASARHGASAARGPQAGPARAG